MLSPLDTFGEGALRDCDVSGAVPMFVRAALGAAC